MKITTIVEGILSAIIITLISNYPIILTGPIMWGLILFSLISSLIFSPIIKIYPPIKKGRYWTGLLISLIFTATILLITLISSIYYANSSDYDPITMQGPLVSLFRKITYVTLFLSSLICAIIDSKFNNSIRALSESKLFLRAVTINLLILAISSIYPIIISIVGMLVYWS